MGFLDKLKDSFTGPLGLGGSGNFGKQFGEGWHDLTGGGKSALGGLWNMVSAPWRDGDQFQKGVQGWFGGIQQASMGGLGKTVGSAFELPLLRQVAGVSDWATTELVRRPMATAFLMEGDQAGQQWRNPGDLFDPDKWNKAYNTTEYVTFGQAGTYASAQLVSGGGGGAYDPRDPAKRKLFYTDPTLKFMSGSADAASVMFGDPTVYLTGGATKLARAKLLSPVMDAAAIKNGQHLKYMDAKGGDNLYRAALTHDEDTFRQLGFADHSGGDIAAGLLHGAARTGDRGLFNNVLLSMYGDHDAFKAVIETAPRYADILGTRYASRTFGDTLDKAAMGDPTAGAKVASLAETKTGAWIDAMEGKGPWGQLNPDYHPGMLVDQKVPQVTISSRWRVGVHQTLAGAPAVVRGIPLLSMVGKRAGAILPSRKFTRALDLNDRDSAGAFRTNMERNPYFTREEVAKWTNAYAMATSAETRGAIAASAENHAAFKVASRYTYLDETTGELKHYTADDLNKVLPEINRLRSNNRRLINSTRRTVADDIYRLGMERARQGRTAEAQGFFERAQEYEKAVERGDAPKHIVGLTDRDGNLLAFPERLGTPSAASPIYTSQTADIMMMADHSALDTAMWWYSKGPLARKVYSAADAAVGVLEAANNVWKPLAIMRPGYIPRNIIGDEAIRFFSVAGGMKFAMSTSNGVANMARNWVGRGRILGDIVASRRAARGVRATDVIEGEVTAEAPAVGSLAQVDDVADNVKRYSSYEAAVADGALDPNELFTRVLDHADNRGDLPADLAHLVSGYRDGLFSDQAFRNHVFDRSMRTQGRDTYRDPLWQRAFLDSVTGAYKDKAVGQVGAPRVVDPFSGHTPDVDLAKLTLSDSRTVGARQVEGTAGIEDRFHIEDLYHYVQDHRSELLEPGALLHADMRPDGRMNLAVARVAEPGIAVGPSGGRRLKLFGREGGRYRDSGADKFAVVTADGARYEFNPHFEGSGEQGRFAAQVSNRGPSGAYADTITDDAYKKLYDESGLHADINPTHPNYGAAYERAVNTQMGNDPAARMLLAGRSVDDVLAWVRNTKEGRGYVERLGPNGAHIYETVHLQSAAVDTYAPMIEGKEAASKALRKKILNHEATHAEFKELMGDLPMPDVHAATIGGAFGGGPADMLRKAADSVFKRLADIPGDKLVRFPFAAAARERHLNALTEIAHARYADKGQFIPASLLHGIEKEANARALTDVKRTLYDASAKHDLARMFDLVIPFGNAIGDSYTKWGRILRKDPTVPIKLAKIWYTPDRAGLVEDQDGNQKVWENGQYVWYAPGNPVTGERGEKLPAGFDPREQYVKFQLPDGIAPDSLEGAKLSMVLNKDTFNTFAALPTGGPIVAIAADKFALNNPEFADNAFVKRFILPYGASANAWKAAVPGSLRLAWEAFGQEDADAPVNDALAIYQAELIRKSQGERATMPTFEEARSKAADLRGLRFWVYMAGASSQFKTPYQPYVDYYRMLLQQEKGDRTAAQSRFYDDVGEEFFILTASVSRNNAGIPATTSAWKASKKWGDLIEGNPDIAGLIIGADGAGSFNENVYQAQLAQGLNAGSNLMQRGRWTLEESVEEVEKRRVWLKYGRLMDGIEAEMAARGITSLRSKRAKDLADKRTEFVNANKFWDQSPLGGRQVSPWFNDYMDRDGARMTRVLTQMGNAIQHPGLQQRDDIRGLIGYLSARDDMKTRMKARGYSSLSTAKAAKLRNEWEATVFGLRESNTAFGQLYNRWLSQDDDLLADVDFGGV